MAETKNRVFVLQDEEGKIRNVIADQAGLDLFIVTIGEETEEGFKTSITTVNVENAGSEEDLAEIQSVVDQAQ